MADLRAKAEIRLEDRFSGPAAAAGDSASKLAKRVTEGRKALDALGRERDALATVEGLGKRVSAAAAKMDIAAKRTAGLRKRLRETRQPTAALRKEFEQAQRQSQGLRRAHREQSDQLRRMKADLLGAASGSRDLARAQQQVEERMAASRASMERLAEAVGRADQARARRDRSVERAARVSLASDGASRIGESVLRFGSRAVSRARDVSKGEGGLQSLDLSPAEARVISRRGLDMQRRVAYVRADDFTRAAYSIRSGVQGVGATGVADLTEAAALLGRATQATTAQMADVVKTGWAIFRRDGEAPREFAGRFSAQIAEAVQKHSTTGPAMQAAIAATKGMPSALGIEDAELIAVLGMLQGPIDSPETVGTTVRALATALPNAQKAYGSRWQLMADGQAVPLPEMLAGMRRLYGDRLEGSELAEIKKNFGSEDAISFFTLLHGGEEALQANIESNRLAAEQQLEYVRIMQRANDNTADARLELVQQRWDAVMIQLGESALPAVERVAEIAGSAADWIGKLAEESPAFATALVTGALTLGAFTIVASKAAIAVASLALAARQGGLWRAERAARKADAPTASGKPTSRLGDAGRRVKDAAKRTSRPIPRTPGGKAGMIALAAGAGATLLLDGRGSEGGEEGDAGGGAPDSPREKIDMLNAVLTGAQLGALAGGSTTLGIGALPGAVIGGLGGALVSWSSGRERDEPEPAPETPPAPVSDSAAPPARQHIGDTNIFVQPLPGEDPETYANRIFELAREADLDDLDGALVDGVI